MLLSERLRPAVTMQGDVICTQGMVGHEMWFIETGIVTVHIRTAPVPEFEARRAGKEREHWLASRGRWVGAPPARWAACLTLCPKDGWAAPCSAAGRRGKTPGASVADGAPP